MASNSLENSAFSAIPQGHPPFLIIIYACLRKASVILSSFCQPLSTFRTLQTVCISMF